MPEPALDEIQWRSPPIAAYFNGVHTNSVLAYFGESPFFDATSNNAALATQAQFNPAMAPLLASRDAFEAKLRTMQGTEFVVVGEPTKVLGGGGTAAGEDTGVWVIRKQYRRKRQGMEDDVTVQATYFVVGENIYQAPAVRDIISSKILSISSHLMKFHSLARSLPTFSPGRGYTYLPPSSSTKGPTSTEVDASRQESAEPTTLSQEPQQTSSSNVESTATNASTGKSSVSTDAPTAQDATAQRDLHDSLLLSLRYGSEYMDENPLQGEPGAFVFSATSERVQQQQQQQKLQQQQKATSTPANSTGTPRGGAGDSFIGKTESAGNTPTPTGGVGVGGVQQQLGLRKGSKALQGAERSPTIVSPTDPGPGGGSGLAKGEVKKRRKSKAAVSPT